MNTQLSSEDRRAVETAAMERAIELSRNGPAWGINPRVGCVILDSTGREIAHGWHRGHGTAHAEVDALQSLADPTLARGATAVVTLEPCNHHGATGPCSQALIDAGVSRVVYALADPGQDSAGGAARLAGAGIDVDHGIAEAAAYDNIRPWYESMRLGRPFVTVKWASSLDGRGAADDGTSQWITGPHSRADVHLRRSEADAIAVGTGTVLADDPSLTARTPEGTLYEHQPVPVVIGQRAIAADAKLHEHPEPLTQHPTISQALDALFKRGIRHLFVEGGPGLASSFLREGYADEVLVYLAPTLIGGRFSAITDLGVASISEQQAWEFSSIDRLGADIRIVARPVRPVPGIPTASALPASPASPSPASPASASPKGN